MFLAVDIGNSRVSFGLFQNHKLQNSFHLATSEAADNQKLEGQLISLMKDERGGKLTKWGSAICSVVPDLTERLTGLIENLSGTKPGILTAKRRLDFKIRYNTEQLGSDRLANVIATRKIYGYPAIVIDMGTATKYDVIDHNGDYIGGLIAPGAGISAESLFDKAAQLFPVQLEQPARFIADNTSDALKGGIYYGFLGQVEKIIDKIIQDLRYTHIHIVATGGYAELFAAEIHQIETVDPSLTLKGIEVLFNQ